MSKDFQEQVLKEMKSIKQLLKQLLERDISIEENSDNESEVKKIILSKDDEDSDEDSGDDSNSLIPDDEELESLTFNSDVGEDYSDEEEDDIQEVKHISINAK